MSRVGPWRDIDLDAASYTSRYDVAIPTGRGFVPVDVEEKQGIWRLTHSEGWTVLGCYDRTQDHRRGSISVFLAEGDHDEQTMKALAAEHFPAVWARIHGWRR